MCTIAHLLQRVPVSATIALTILEYIKTFHLPWYGINGTLQTWNTPIGANFAANDIVAIINNQSSPLNVHTMESGIIVEKCIAEGQPAVGGALLFKYSVTEEEDEDDDDDNLLELLDEKKTKTILDKIYRREEPGPPPKKTEEPTKPQESTEDSWWTFSDSSDSSDSGSDGGGGDGGGD